MLLLTFLGQQIDRNHWNYWNLKNSYFVWDFIWELFLNKPHSATSRKGSLFLSLKNTFLPSMSQNFKFQVLKSSANSNVWNNNLKVWLVLPRKNWNKIPQLSCLLFIYLAFCAAYTVLILLYIVIETLYLSIHYTLSSFHVFTVYIVTS